MVRLTTWAGIAQNIQGYNEVDDDGNVTVRSEVARLTRLYDRAVRNNTANNPDMYVAGPGVDVIGGTKRAVTVTAPQPIAIAAPAPAAPAAALPVPASPVGDPDASPASAPPKRTDTLKPVETPVAVTQPATPQTAPNPAPTQTPQPSPIAATALEIAKGSTTEAVAHDGVDEAVPAIRKSNNEDELHQQGDAREDPAAAGANPASGAPVTNAISVTTGSATPISALGPGRLPQAPTSSTATNTPSRDPDESPATAPPRKRAQLVSLAVAGVEQNVKA